MAHRIADLHTSAVELILPATVDLARTIIGERAAEKLNLVTLSDDTMCRWIGDMAEDVHHQLIDQIK